MKRIFILAFTALLLCLSCAPRMGYVTITGFAQGGTYTVKFNMEGVEETPEQIKASVDTILKHIDFSLSGYNKNSILSHFNAGCAVKPDSFFLDIYARAYEIYEATGGAVDVAAGPLFDLWGFGFSTGEMPSDEKIAHVMEDCGLKNFVRDIRSAMVFDKISQYGMYRDERYPFKFDYEVEEYQLDREYTLPTLNYNAIAQGYSCDVVARYLYSLGVKDMLVDIGEIYCDGVNPSGQPWSLGIDSPVDGNQELGAQIQGIFRAPAGPHGIVTSGNYRKFYIRDGKKYAHTIDPRTGYPVDHNLLSATVVAPDATTADAYATYCMVIGLEAAMEFISSRPDLEACLIYDDNGAYSTWCSSGFFLESLQ